MSRQGISRYGTRHLAALGITERFDRCICVVVSEETGTLSLANLGRLERPITSSRLLELLKEFMSSSPSTGIGKTSQNPISTSLSSNKPSDHDLNEKNANLKKDFFPDQK